MKNDDPKQREPKKTVSIEVRVSEEDKHAFWDACRAANQPASAVLRRLMGLFVAFRNLRQRMFAMMTRVSRRPVSAALAGLALAVSLSLSLLLAPVAAADVRLTYQVVVEDGIGQIVSQGQAVFNVHAGDADIISDTLGEDVRYAFAAQACDPATETSCAEGGAMVHFSIWESRNGEDVVAIERGIAVVPSGETRFETVLSDGRVLSVLFLPQA